MAIWGKRKADRVAEALLRQIASGRLRPGHVLEREAELAASHGVTRSVVREALRQLEAHGLVRPVKRRGTVVLDPLESPSPDVLRAMLEPEPGVFDGVVLRDLLEVRATLDVEMSVLAARRRVAADLAAFEVLLERLEENLGQPDGYATVMEDFISCVARATQNRIYQALVSWHHRIRADIDAMNLMIRLANEPHLSGITFLVQLIAERRADDVRTLVEGVHAWSIPRVLAAAALASGAPLDLRADLTLNAFSPRAPL
ncbi:MAG: GntR family transcriptional regulator [Myxococcota bacterium]